MFSFEGRATRLQFWLCQLVLFISYQMVGAAARAMNSTLRNGQAAHAVTPDLLVIALGGSLALLGSLGCLLWIGLAVVVKRWHDRGKSGVWATFGFIPVFGWTWQGIECGFLEGTLGPNKFGPSPKGIVGVMYGEPLAETFS